MTTKKLPTPIETRVVYVDPNDPAAVAEANEVFSEMFNTLADPGPRLAQLLEEARALLPASLRDDRYWLPCTLIFQALFPTFIPTYFDFFERIIDIPRFDQKARGLSHGQSVLIALAFHLYNNTYPLPENSLISLRVLDKFHFELAILAIRLAHDLSTSPAQQVAHLKGEPMP